MLTFLRKIRRSLIESGSARKYLLYAIGEILLVMVGILLALQVNNWNELRKDRIKEKEVLLEIRKDLEETLNEDLVEDMVVHDLFLHSTQITLQALVNNRPFHDSLYIHIINCFDDTRTYYKSGGYQSLLSKEFI